MVVVVGLTALVKRGVPIALMHVGLLGGTYVLWFVIIGHEGTSGDRGADLSQAIRFIGR